MCSLKSVPTHTTKLILLIDGGIFILQYEDDTILFMEHDIANAINMKLILSIFEQLLGLKIIFY
jgi:hypothetical protein